MQRHIPHFSSLSALRFFAAIIVAFGHSMGHLNAIDPKYFEGIGIPVLMVFFHVLSGFTLGYIYPQFGERREVFRFWLARIGRIWPVHILLLVLIVVFFPARQHFDDPRWWGGLAANATLVQSWFPAFRAPRAFNAVAWTLSTELALYLVFPFLIGRWRRIWWKALPVFFLLAVGVVWISSKGASIPGSWLERLQIIPEELVYLHPATRLLEFATGMTLAVFWAGARERCRVSVLLGTVLEFVALAVAVAVMLGSFPFGAMLEARFGISPECAIWLRRMLLPLGPFALLILIFSLNKGYITRALSHPRLVFLGELSFSIYLLHVMLIWALEQPNPTPVRMGILNLCFWGMTFLASHLIYTVWEQPGRRFFRNLLDAPTGKTISDRLQDRAGAARSWKMPTVEGMVLAALLVTVWFENHNRRFVEFVDAKAATKMEKQAPSKLRGYQFGDGFALKAVRHHWSVAGLELELLWESLKDQRLDYIQAVHVVDAEGNLLGGADHPQERNQCWVRSGECWVDKVILDPAKLQNASSIGLGLYQSGQDLVPIDRGFRDWRGRRLLIPLQSQMPPPEHRLQQEGESKAAVKASLSGSQNVAFGQRLMLRGLKVTEEPGGLRVDTTWKTLTPQRLDGRLTIRAVGDGGRELNRITVSHDQAAACVAADMSWMDSMLLPQVKLAAVRRLELGVQRGDADLVPSADGRTGIPWVIDVPSGHSQ